MSLFYHFDTNHSCNKQKRRKQVTHSVKTAMSCQLLLTTTTSSLAENSITALSGRFLHIFENDWHIYPNFCNISGNLCLWSDSLQNCSVLRIKFLALKLKENLAQAHYITLSLTEDLVTSVGEQEQWNHQLKKKYQFEINQSLKKRVDLELFCSQRYVDR